MPKSMTVGQLIEKLQQETDKNKTVTVYPSTSLHGHRVQNVEFEKNEVQIYLRLKRE